MGDSLSTVEIAQYSGNNFIVLWSDSFSTVGDSLSTVEVAQYSGDNFSTVDDIPYIGGIPSVHAGG